MEFEEYLANQLATNDVEWFSVEEIISPFRTHEFGKDPGKNLWDNIIPAMVIADTCRNDLGFPIHINSSYRCHKHNKEEGGSSDSLHLSFNALDLHPVKKTSKNVKALQKWFDNWDYGIIIRWRGKDMVINPSDTGQGKYSWGIHIDTRGLLGRKSPVRWGG